ncbi:unnamed protein product [Pieris macdunnoughi]|uniref:Uncharacterized protein n=1 Tax=Pieris macdunnoughi TaxID=345717 RepID=A0A821Y5S6_9NEOP|nr:unnamed protein product [Pieris macdunnoughi]
MQLLSCCLYGTVHSFLCGAGQWQVPDSLTRLGRNIVTLRCKYWRTQKKITQRPGSSNVRLLSQRPSTLSYLARNGPPSGTGTFWLLAKVVQGNFCLPSVPPLAHTSKEKADFIGRDDRGLPTTNNIAV